ncbi:MAG TPA: FtsH protease activity modulator HflK [Deltaproteobacteria bacterium]|nr:FtsH protease activity modulator HflK [Deltaproteobacteria bacterium]
MPWGPDDEYEGQGEYPSVGNVVRMATSRIGKSGLGKGKFWIILLIAFLVILGISTSMYTISTGHRGVILRFGRYAGTVMPGFHFKVPFGVDKVYSVYTDKIDTEAFGFRSVSQGIRSEFEKSPATERESLMLTGDLNVIDVEWIVQYRREDPKKYLFSIKAPIQALRDISESVIRRIVGNHTFDYILQNREEVNKQFRKELQNILDDYNSGIKIANVRLQNVVPPEAVKGAFNEVNEAQQERERLINQAQETYNKEIPRAKGEAERTINKARGYALERVNMAKGDVARFLDVLNEYKKAREVTKRRLYIETLQAILPQANKIYVVDSKQKSILPLLQLNPELMKEEGLK